MEDDDVKGEEEDDVENDDVEEKEEDDTEDADVGGGGPIPRPSCRVLFERAQSKLHFNISQEPLYTGIYGKNAAAQNPGPHFVRACTVTVGMQVNISQEPLYTGIYGKNAAAQNPGPHFVRACTVTVGMQVNISQEPLYTEIYMKNAAPQSEHPDQAPAFTPTVRTPQCGHTVWGKNAFANSETNFRGVSTWTFR